MRSTTSDLIALTHNLQELHNNQYIHLIALDFTKAFDSVRHSYLTEQLAGLPIPDWIIAFLDNGTHSTKFSGLVSVLTNTNARIVQGLGPVNFKTTISRLKMVHPTNRLIKYTDDICWYLQQTVLQLQLS